MSKINKSWEKSSSEVHSPLGTETIRTNVKWGLMRLYGGLAESMFRYEFGSDAYNDLRVMSADKVPEKFLLRNGSCVWFRIGNQIHCLPYTTTASINIYGEPVSWNPVPTGWNASLKGNGSTADNIAGLVLDATNSVIMRNDLFGGSDYAYIESMVDELVDNHMTMNQLQLLAKSPYVFNVSEDNLLTAKNFYLALSRDKPVIFTNSLGESTIPTVPTQVQIDTGLFELFDRFENQILTYLGFPSVPITKRAQQSVSEVQSNNGMVYTRRQERYRQRAIACERITEMFDAPIRCYSVVDELGFDTDNTYNPDGTDSDPAKDGVPNE